MRYESSLPARLSELVILLVARAWTQNFEWAVHAPIAREAGLSEAIIDAIAAYAYALALASPRAPGAVPRGLHCIACGTGALQLRSRHIDRGRRVQDPCSRTLHGPARTTFQALANAVTLKQHRAQPLAPVGVDKQRRLSALQRGERGVAA